MFEYPIFKLFKILLPLNYYNAIPRFVKVSALNSIIDKSNSFIVLEYLLKYIYKFTLNFSIKNLKLYLINYNELISTSLNNFFL